MHVLSHKQTSFMKIKSWQLDVLLSGGSFSKVSLGEIVRSYSRGVASEFSLGEMKDQPPHTTSVIPPILNALQLTSPVGVILILPLCGLMTPPIFTPSPSSCVKPRPPHLWSPEETLHAGSPRISLKLLSERDLGLTRKSYHESTSTVQTSVYVSATLHV